MPNNGKKIYLNVIFFIHKVQYAINAKVKSILAIDTENLTAFYNF